MILTFTSARSHLWFKCRKVIYSGKAHILSFFPSYWSWKHTFFCIEWIKHTSSTKLRRMRQKNSVICSLSSCVILCMVLIPVAFPPSLFDWERCMEWSHNKNYMKVSENSVKNIFDTHPWFRLNWSWRNHSYWIRCRLVKTWIRFNIRQSVRISLALRGRIERNPCTCTSYLQ